MAQGSQSSPKQLWTVAQGGLTGGEDLMMTSAFLPKGLLFYIPQVFAMFPLGHHSLGSFPGFSFTDGFGTGHLSCLNWMASSCLSLHDSHFEIGFGLQNCLGKEPWLWWLMWPPEIWFDATTPPVPRWLFASWHLGTSWGEAYRQWLCWHWPGALMGPLGDWHFYCYKQQLLGRC